MTPEEAHRKVRDALRQVAPDVDVDTLDPATSLRDELELDSLDFESFVVQLSERTGRRIDEDDYPELVSVASCVEFLSRTGLGSRR